MHLHLIRCICIKSEDCHGRALKLISHKLCPYVQRAVIALTEKGVPFERIDIDLASKPDWFLKISPLGKVPLLLVETEDGEAALFESNVICEYIEETQAGAKLHPRDALERAQHRAWMEFGSTILSDMGPGDDGRSRGVREQTAGGRREVCPRRGGAGRGSIFCRRELQPGGRGVRADLPLFRRVRSLTDLSVFADTPKVRAASGAGEATERAHGGGSRLSALLHAFLVRHDAHLLKLAA